MTNVEYLIKHSFINDSHSNTAIYIILMTILGVRAAINNTTVSYFETIYWLNCIKTPINNPVTSG